jgi:hypothetical protein
MYAHGRLVLITGAGWDMGRAAVIAPGAETERKLRPHDLDPAPTAAEAAGEV